MPDILVLCMNRFEKRIKDVLKKELKKEAVLEVPPNPEMGDYAFPCFSLSKDFKKNPNEIAQELCKKIKLDNTIKKVVVNGPYLNFFINKEELAEAILKDIEKQKENYGKGKKNKKIMVEFFHANTHKAIHIGHMRNISLGEALCKLLEFAGFKVVRTNYQGDIGPHVAKCIWGYLNLKEKEPKENKGVWLGNIYSKANEKIKGNEKLENEIKLMTKELYEHDKRLESVWKKTRRYCLDDFNKLYKEFGVKFDRLYFESEVEELGRKISKELLKKGVAKESEGAVIIDLDNLGVVVLVSKEGYALYHAKDLGLAKIKFKEYNVDKSVHVVGKEQERYFEQLFKIFEMIKSPAAGISHHLIYNLVMLPEGKMSSREGNVVLYHDLINKLKKLSEKEVKKRHKDWKKKDVEKAVKQISFGALKFAMINRENNKEIIFDWNKALDFEGETGPYVQYAYARICSILRKYGKKIGADVDFSLLKQEQNIISMLERYPYLIESTAKSYKPHLITRYLLDLAQAFNEYYHRCPVLQAEEKLKKARLLLIDCIKHVLKSGLQILGIEAPERM